MTLTTGSYASDGLACCLESLSTSNLWNTKEQRQCVPGTYRDNIPEAQRGGSNTRGRLCARLAVRDKSTENALLFSSTLYPTPLFTVNSEDFKLSIDLESEIMAAPSPETRSTLDKALGDLIEYLATDPDRLNEC